MVGRTRFELVKAMPVDLQSTPFGHSGTYPFLDIIVGPHSRGECCYRLAPKGWQGVISKEFTAPWDQHSNGTRLKKRLDSANGKPAFKLF